MKMHYYLREWGLDLSKSHAFVMKTIRQTIRFSYSSACTKSGHKLARTHGARLVVQQSEATWLGVHAFHTVLSRKPQAYTGILKTLRFELALPKYRRYKKRFRDVISEGLSTLTLLSF
ncbi:hypothetical protein K466DRAFT_572951 [Polyporus arcularius HHB13444]|uniref:Telomerase reverse transcriptase C-terminal extension domain-containing protein n=2 Tax=Polyporaceae TaxID=5317 RepID=A0A5C3PW42_9APHY|nr:hypothetical protein OH76DRAFT_1335620 [Polyporus brumalis]TFK92680.1 hypothetical protein K466DRAFT_572951 [Polyporus arcularius HHB13444]